MILLNTIRCFNRVAALVGGVGTGNVTNVSSLSPVVYSRSVYGGPCKWRMFFARITTVLNNESATRRLSESPRSLVFENLIVRSSFKGEGGTSRPDARCLPTS